MRELGLDLISVRLQTLTVALRAASVRQILGTRGWIPIPGARPELPGIVMWARQATLLVDLARFSSGLELLAKGSTRSRLLILSHAGMHLALPVDSVSEVWKTHDDNVRQREVSDFALCQEEVVSEDTILPIFSADVLLSQLNLEAVA